MQQAPIILDLCGGSGSWSWPYVELGYDVRLVDLPDDVRLIRWQDIEVRGILAAPPCTMFSRSGHHIRRSDDELLDALSIVDACLRAVVIYKPRWWALENPVGRLVHYLGQPRLRFNPCDYGDPYTKLTNVWGNFTLPNFRYVDPIGGSWVDLFDGSNARMRAATPAGFAQAFCEANR